MIKHRCGILPLRIETGRFVGEAPDQRLCRFCQLNSIEDETHFLLDCTCYIHIREQVFGDIILTNDFINSSVHGKLNFIIHNYPRKIAKFLMKSYLKRKIIVYN